MRLRRTVTILMVALLATACGIMENKASVAHFSTTALDDNERGVVLMSTGAPGSCTAVSTALKVFEATSRRPPDPEVFIQVDASVHKSEFSTHHGTVNAFSLPQGRYFLQPFILNPYVKSLRVPLFYFDVKAGETTYLGEIFMTRSCSMSNQFQVRDEFKRDWQMAIEKNPPLARRDAVKRLTSVGAVVTP